MVATPASGQWRRRLRRCESIRRGRAEAGQALVLVLGVVAALLLGFMVLAAFGQALGAKGHSQRVADLAAMSAARSMSRDYERLFEPPVLGGGLPNPHHLTTAQYLLRARRSAVRGARRNGARLGLTDVSFPGGSFAPVRVRVRVRGRAEVRVDRGAPRTVEVRGRATAEIAPSTGAQLGMPVRRDDISLSITSAFRSDAEQAKLFAANPNSKWVAPPGTSLHRYATELDLGPPGAYGWLAAHARPFGFIHRYAWEAWH